MKATRLRIRVRLKECLDLHEARTGRRMTYAELAAKTGLTLGTVQAIAVRDEYNATLMTVQRLATALGVGLDELLEWRR
jgi:transcriptional regulator with XRE-family HTH domain